MPSAERTYASRRIGQPSFTGVEIDRIKAGRKPTKLQIDKYLRLRDGKTPVSVLAPQYFDRVVVRTLDNRTLVLPMSDHGYYVKDDA